MTNLNKWIVRYCLLVIGAAVLLGGCGLSGRHGSLAAGVKYEAAGQYRAAYIEAKKVLQHDSKNGTAWLLLGKASLMLGNPRDALSDLQNAQANGIPKSQWAIPMGQTLLVTQKYATLLKTVSPANLEFSETKVRVLALRGDAYLGLKEMDQAKQSYQSALALNANEPQALVGLAKVSAIGNDPETANKYLQQALASDPDYADAWTLKGDLAFNTRDFTVAEEDYQKALSVKQTDVLPQKRFYAMARLADSQIQQNKFDKALGNIQTLEKMAPEQPYPHYLHAVIYYKQGHYNEATSELQQVLKVAPDNEPAQLLLGAVNYAQGNFGQAEMFLSNVMGMDQKNAQARKLLALTLYQEGRSKQALDVLRPVIPGKPSDSQLLALMQREAAVGIGAPGSETAEGSAANPQNAQLASAGQAIAAGNENEALRLLKALPAGDASVESKRYGMMVLAYVREKRPDEAVRVAAEYAHKAPDSSAAHLLYGTALVTAGKHAQARTEYLQAYKLDPKNLAALLSLGSLDMLEGHDKDATGRYELVLKKDPRNAVAMTALGRIAAAQGDKAQAISRFKQAIAVAPKYVIPYVGLIVVYSSSGQFTEASDTARKLVEIEPNNPAALNAMGAVQLNAGQYKDALKPLQQAVKLAPQASLYRTNLARAQILNKDFKAAEANLNQVIKSAPDQVPAVALLAFLKMQDGDMPAAISLANTLQKQTSTQAAGFTLEGDLYMSKHAYAKAAQAYQRSLKLDYNRPTMVRTFLAFSDAGSNDAKDVLREWLNKHPDDEAARMLLGQYYMDRAENNLSAEQYQLVLKAYPSSIEALNNLAWVYTQQGNPKAVSLAERVYKLAPNSASIKDTYGWALTVNGQAKTALPILSQATKEAPTIPAIQYHLAVAQERTGDHAGAKATLQTLLKSGASFPGKDAAKKLYRDLGGTPGSAAGQ
ncbi:MAG: XrtA/PEP-CTERM system TPR-repeat protein PrsT [Gammaproteobacteria bacterium]